MRLIPLSRTVVRAAQIVVMISLFVLLWLTMDGREAARIFFAADLRWILAAAVALTVQTVLSSERWRVTAAQLGIVIRPARALREYYLAQFVNQSLPGGVVGDAGRAIRSRDQAGLLLSGQAVIFERLAGQIGLLAVFLAALPLTFVLPCGFDWPLWLIGPVTVGLVIVAGLPLGIGAAVWIAGPGDYALRRFLARLSLALIARGVLLKQVVLSLGTAIFNLAAFAFCAFALGVELPILAVTTLVPLILFSMVLPLTIGGWGIREGAAVVLFPVVGATASEGLATSVAFGLVIAASVVPGMILTWLATKGRDDARPQHDREAQPAPPDHVVGHLNQPPRPTRHDG